MARQGHSGVWLPNKVPNFLLCLTNRTKSILFISVMADGALRLPHRSSKWLSSTDAAPSEPCVTPRSWQNASAPSAPVAIDLATADPIIGSQTWIQCPILQVKKDQVYPIGLTGRNRPSATAGQCSGSQWVADHMTGSQTWRQCPILHIKQDQVYPIGFSNGGIVQHAQQETSSARSADATSACARGRAAALPRRRCRSRTGTAPSPAARRQRRR
jgi:hypothetical protein